MKYLGIDFGEIRIGLAIGESETKIATPYKVVGSADDVVKAIKEEEIDRVVIGLPYKMANDPMQKGMMQVKVENFIKLIKSKIDIEITAVDERLSSKAADALSGCKKTKAPRDALSAMLILQTYLDSENIYE